MKQHDINERERHKQLLKARFPNCSESFLRANSAGGAGIRAHHEKPTQGNTLVSALPRKGKGGKGAVLGAARRHISFRVFSQRPADYDGYSIKELQDALVHAGILDDDAWHLLYGTVISEKAHSQEEERTEIELT